MNGPWMLYVSLASYVRMLDDFKANCDKSIVGRLLETPGLLGIKGTSQLSGTNVVLVQMTSDVVDLLDGIQPTTVMWETHGGMLLNFKVLAIMVPRIKADGDGRSGIVHYS
jgi:hypothetical protein